jgi:pimeloyl-ACP methyl ester carboxylesterase
MIMARAKANGIQIECETFGDRSGRPFLLMMGTGRQMILWPKEFCGALSDKGHFVIVFDKRDPEVFSKMEEAGGADFAEALGTLMKGENIKVPYTFNDMGDEAVGLLDALGIEKAHICGMSMGGAIAATLAINHPSRLSSLILIYSVTGNPNLPPPEPEIMSLPRTPPTASPNAYAEQQINTFRIIPGSGSPLDEEWVSQVFRRQYDRSYYPRGLARNLWAGFASRDQLSSLQSIKAPTLVIHYDEDPHVPVENCWDAAEEIPGAELMIIKGLGDYPPHRGPWPHIVDAISSFTGKVAV